ncbi:hypothetical protein SAMN06297280_3515 [Arsukibacterium tuosuense]|uniref:SMODS-associating 2TM beta-strand rich effector domain-containing protein n=1 Tax=Arsukibacterium tuosuense TaxID=1323745 RepID=A0A285JF35_9GAMM|nr:hypothetical protein [Arsukibacterium tuosuense]SNY58910.1 hypothetical protein SAMN06297280_3515 [Arsukibacterium tuosuense]
MNQNFLSIILGIPSGIFSALFIWLFFVIYQKQFKPWFQELVYRGVEIEGIWQNDDQNGSSDGTSETPTVTSILNISLQQGHTIKGTFSQQFVSVNEKRYGAFKAEGHIIDGVVILTLMPESRSKSTYGTLVLNLGSASLSLEGIFTYKGAISNNVTHQNVKLMKKP